MSGSGRQRLHHQAYRRRETAVSVAHLVAAASGSAALRPEVSDEDIRLLLEAIYQRYHYDFRQYAVASLRRRLLHAMGQLHCETLPELQHKVLSDVTMFPRLLEYLTVQVSELFRDPEF